MRKRQYNAPELAKRLKEFLVDKKNFPEKSVGHQENRIYLRYGQKDSEEEYIGVFKFNDKGHFIFQIENPDVNLKSRLERELMKSDAVLKKGSLKKYNELFKRISVEEDVVNYRGVEIPVISLDTKIKKISLGEKKHLSSSFMKSLFEYNIQPFILTVEKYKSNSK